MSLEPYNCLVKLVARALYDVTLSDGQRGVPVAVLDALTRYPWAREEDLANALKVGVKQLGLTLRFLEEEKLICRYHQEEIIDGPKIAVAAPNDGNQLVKKVAEKLKLQTQSYCCLDYAQIYNVIWYRIYKTKKILKDELDSICPFCGRRNFDALQLVSLNEEYFPCESCKAASDTHSVKETRDGDDSARKHRRDELTSLLRRMEDQLKPLQQLLDRVKDLPVPKLALHDLDIRALIAARSNGDPILNDSSNPILNYSSNSSQAQIYGGVPMPFLGEKMVEVASAGVKVKQENNEDIKPTTRKVLPPWMTKQGMILTKEQHREVKNESKVDQSSVFLDGKKPKDENDELMKSYTAAILKRIDQDAATRMQPEAVGVSTSDISNCVASDSSERRVGHSDDVELEEAPAGNTTRAFKRARC